MTANNVRFVAVRWFISAKRRGTAAQSRRPSFTGTGFFGFYNWNWNSIRTSHDPGHDTCHGYHDWQKCFVATAAPVGVRWDNVFFDTIFGLNPFFLTFTTWTSFDGLVKLKRVPPHTGPPLRWIFGSAAQAARFGVSIDSLVLFLFK